ncbi:hypothetical protein Bca52824_088933 [Brassica carinata]|uniref:Uncharacterized protein n=1 Tax=Brassica carinata TaxID=52824 RepID=A0A8X7PDP2_BRACI|nr:hypothetical protein Bca52824_088933 [Brassica carinata]
MKAVASRRQSRTVIGGTDQPSETRTGRKYRNRTDGAGESMSDLTAEQLFKINELHMKTVQEENMLTKQSATLQEDTADMPIAVAAFHKERIGEADVEVELALDKYEDEMARMLAEADKLRLRERCRLEACGDDSGGEFSGW